MTVGMPWVFLSFEVGVLSVVFGLKIFCSITIARGVSWRSFMMADGNCIVEFTTSRMKKEETVRLYCWFRPCLSQDFLGASSACRLLGLSFLPILQAMIVGSGMLLPSVAFAGGVAGRVMGPDGAGIAQAIVFVQALPASVSSPKSAPALEMDQVHKEFTPPLLPVAVGSQVRFPNRDQIHHHVYSFSRTKSFELPLYKGEDASPVLFDKPGVVKIGCNIHDWMSAIIFVVPTPYFALSDETGHFALPQIPSGTYTLVAWHELSQIKVEETAQPVQVGEQPTEVSFTLTLSARRPAPASRKGGNY